MKSIRIFKNTVRRHYRKNRRNFLWRNTRNPYEILVSEIMLQQTQTKRVEIKYPLFLKKFPDFETLSKASLAEVLSAWQGMGYNRRAKYLKSLAEKITREYKGRLPSEPKVLSELPGIGKGTAGAIAAFAFNLPVPFIETNIRRVYIHFFFPQKESIRDIEILRLVEKTLDWKNPREWYYALMDYGAMLGKHAQNPNRQSAAYKKQTPFKGSLREIRGKIVKTLAANETIRIKNLEKLFAERNIDFASAYRSLVKDGFLKEERGIVSFV